jgi:hypothetical protein
VKLGMLADISLEIGIRMRVVVNRGGLSVGRIGIYRVCEYS